MWDSYSQDFPTFLPSTMLFSYYLFPQCLWPQSSRIPSQFLSSGTLNEVITFLLCPLKINKNQNRCKIVKKSEKALQN